MTVVDSAAELAGAVLLIDERALIDPALTPQNVGTLSINNSIIANNGPADTPEIVTHDPSQAFIGDQFISGGSLGEGVLLEDLIYDLHLLDGALPVERNGAIARYFGQEPALTLGDVFANIDPLDGAVMLTQSIHGGPEVQLNPGFDNLALDASSRTIFSYSVEDQAFLPPAFVELILAGVNLDIGGSARLLAHLDPFG